MADGIDKDHHVGLDHYFKGIHFLTRLFKGLHKDGIKPGKLEQLVETCKFINASGDSDNSFHAGLPFKAINRLCL
jgi:hypothetical protein